MHHSFPLFSRFQLDALLPCLVLHTQNSRESEPLKTEIAQFFPAENPPVLFHHTYYKIPASQQDLPGLHDLPLSSPSPPHPAHPAWPLACSQTPPPRSICRASAGPAPPSAWTFSGPATHFIQGFVQIPPPGGLASLTVLSP